MSRRPRSLVVFALTATVLFLALRLASSRPASKEEKAVLPALQGAGPRWWKGNLHTHSFWSDGDDFPEMIADWYKRHGYQFLALSDHNVLSEGERWMDVPTKGVRSLALAKYRARFGDVWVERRKAPAKDKKGEKDQVRLKPLAEFRSLLEEPGKFLLIPAEEITSRYTKYPVHLNAINLRDVVGPLQGDNVAETITVNERAVSVQRKKTGVRMLTSLNHPNFGWGVRAEDMVLARDLRFFEVYNGHPSVRNEGDAQHASSERIWDIALSLRRGKLGLPILYALATDDAHGYHSFGVGKVNPGRGWVMVRAPYLSAEAVVRALEAGDFYASTGVALDEVKRAGDRLTLAIRGEPGVTYQTEFIATLKGAPLTSNPVLDKKGRSLEVTQRYSDELGKVVARSEELKPSYRLTGKELYVRARVTSSRAHPNPYRKGDREMAWTQPVVP